MRRWLRGFRNLVATGLTIELPPGYEGSCGRVGSLALKHAITIPNAPATIDPGYRGEIKVILPNLGRDNYEIQPGTASPKW
jgi:dUTP pyrophosphatase